MRKQLNYQESESAAPRRIQVKSSISGNGRRERRGRGCRRNVSISLPSPFLMMLFSRGLRRSVENIPAFPGYLLGDKKLRSVTANHTQTRQERQRGEKEGKIRFSPRRGCKNSTACAHIYTFGMADHVSTKFIRKSGLGRTRLPTTGPKN